MSLCFFAMRISCPSFLKKGNVVLKYHMPTEKCPYPKGTA